jgi:hypothetical protein
MLNPNSPNVERTPLVGSQGFGTLDRAATPRRGAVVPYGLTPHKSQSCRKAHLHVGQRKETVTYPCHANYPMLRRRYLSGKQLILGRFVRESEPAKLLHDQPRTSCAPGETTPRKRVVPRPHGSVRSWVQGNAAHTRLQPATSRSTSSPALPPRSTRKRRTISSSSIVIVWR